MGNEIYKYILFSYYYDFNKKGKYNIKYIFKKNITKIDYMFYECENLTNIDLSNFNTNNVTYMGCMFFWCDSLKKENIITKDKMILSFF